jgi:hypothetical protein
VYLQRNASQKQLVSLRRSSSIGFHNAWSTYVELGFLNARSARVEHSIHALPSIVMSLMQVSHLSITVLTAFCAFILCWTGPIEEISDIE